MFDHNRFHYFYQVVPSSGEYSFVSYADSLTGTTYKAIQSVDHTGRKRPFVVKFSARERIYKFPKKQTIEVEINGVPKKTPLYDYIKNFPYTEGSPFAHGAEPLIKEMDEIKDAKVAVSRKKRRIEAGNIVLDMSPEERRNFAPLIGLYTDEPDVHLHRILEFADQDPEMFFKLYEAPDKDLKSLIKKAVTAGLIKKQGKALIYEKEVYGDEDDMIAALAKDAVKKKALETNLKTKQ